ncbi:MAG: chlorite dismutase family protein [Acidobacteria bacterium]|nr:chlorite dismutase family protein [Acidobacteriota bacterium]
MPIELVNKQRETAEQSGLRLVDDPVGSRISAPVETQFVSYHFLKADAEWRKLDHGRKSELSREFISLFDDYTDDFLVFAYSLIGFDSKADLMFWRIGSSMDRLQEMTARMNRTGLGSHLITAATYLSVTKKRMFVSESTEDRFHVNAGEKAYHFFYPCPKGRGWHEKSAEEREALIEDGMMVGRRFPNIKIHMTHGLGFGEYDYLFSFETDEPKDFVALADELRSTGEVEKNLGGSHIFSCRKRPLAECLEALG